MALDGCAIILITTWNNFPLEFISPLFEGFLSVYLCLKHSDLKEINEAITIFNDFHNGQTENPYVLHPIALRDNNRKLINTIDLVSEVCKNLQYSLRPK